MFCYSGKPTYIFCYLAIRFQNDFLTLVFNSSYFAFELGNPSLYILNVWCGAGVVWCCDASDGDISLVGVLIKKVFKRWVSDFSR